MSLFNTLNTSISGMAAQATKLSVIGDNIANVSTTGYKTGSTEFETLLGNEATSGYESGGVTTKVRYALGEQGTVNSTSTTTDLAIAGNGYFVVQDSNGATALTRAGAFVTEADGTLKNTAGYTLMGYDLQTGSSALEPLNVSSSTLSATASTSGTLSVNLPSTATAVAALPSTNASGATYTEKTTLTAYDSLGTAVTLDVYLSKTDSNTWEAAVYNHADAASGGSFPYANAALTTTTLSFDPSTGALASTSPSSLSIAIPGGNTIAVDVSGSTQLATSFSTKANTVNGNAPSSISSITIGSDGIVSAVYTSGTIKALSQIAMGTVASPANLTSLTGNAYAVSSTSGSMIIGTAGSTGLGTIASSSLEGSTVDLATELTSMIAAQRGYEANSKVLQTTSDLLKIIDNLQV